MTTSAVHLELVTDYSTDGFIATYRRFAARRGIPNTIYSDCGTNFIGADSALKSMFIEGTQDNQRLAKLFVNDQTTWNFNPPVAPHMGGKWEAEVKSVKYHLRRTSQVASYTTKTTTILEALVSSTPSTNAVNLEVASPFQQHQRWISAAAYRRALPTMQVASCSSVRSSPWTRRTDKGRHDQDGHHNSNSANCKVGSTTSSRSGLITIFYELLMAGGMF
uniref:uncharacterized protein LOC117611366 n=1 Tax=Osmia lignaria TaxID=473952 RepID=UPI00147950F0|nr:uncharacterized protein LOC117611366 [Osmia lignaria]